MKRILILFFPKKNFITQQNIFRQQQQHNSQLRLPLDHAEGDGPGHVEDHGDQQLPLEGEVGRVEEGDGAAQALHELKDGHKNVFRCEHQCFLGFIVL